MWRNLSLKALSLGLERGCRLAVTVAAAPILGEAAFGRFVFASTVTAFLVLAADLGLGTWSTRALARGRPEGDVVVRVGLGLRAVLALPYSIAVLVVAWSVDADTRVPVVLLGVASLLNAFADHFGAILRGTERFALEARLSTVRALMIIFVGGIALVVGRSLDALSIALAVASLGGALYGATLTKRAHRLAWGGTADGPVAKGAIRESLPIWVAGILSLAYFKVDTLFVRGFAGDAELGAYGAAYKIFEGAMLLPSIVLAVTFPSLVRTGADSVLRGHLERRIAVGLLALGLGTGAVAWLLRAPLVALLFGPQFAHATDCLRILAIGMPLVFLNYALTHFLVARHRERVNTVLSLMMLLATVALDLLLIPRGAGPGAATATVLSEALLTFMCLLALGALRARPQPARGEANTDQTQA